MTSCRCANRALAFDVGRAGFQADDVLLLELQFGGVFDGDDALGVRDEAGENVEQRGLAGAGAAGDEHVQAGLHDRRQQLEHRLGEALVRRSCCAGRDWIAAEAADGKAGAVEGQRRNDGVDARAIGEAGIHHGRGFVDAAADAGHDAVDDLHQVPIVLERQAGEFELAAALDVHPVEAVDQDVGDGGIFEQRFERAEAKDFVENLAGQSLALGEAERNRFAVHGIADEDENFLARRFAGGTAEFFQVEAIEDLAMQVGFDLLVLTSLKWLAGLP